MDVDAFIESDVDTDSSDDTNAFVEKNADGFVESDDDTHTDDQVNFIRIPWDGSPPKIIIAKSQRSLIKNPFEADHDANKDETKCVRKILFCRDLNDKRKKTLKVWDLPLTWNNDNIRSAFGIFGTIQTVALKQQSNIINRHCLIRFKHSSNIEFALNYDSAQIIQPSLKGSIQLGINKYLIHYIKSRPLNVNQLQFEVDKFMVSFDKLQKQKKEEQRKKPRRNRGWIQKRVDGWTTVHYPNRWERKKNRAYRMSEDDTFNAPPEPKVYDVKTKEAYYKHNDIKDIYKKRERKLVMKQNKAKQKMKKQMSKEHVQQIKQRMSIAGSRLQQSMQHKQRWNKDMSQTTHLRKNRNFKPT